MDPVDETEPTLCLELSIGGVTAGWRKGLSIVWPRGRTGEGLEGGLEETLSRELGKASLKTIPCLRVPPGGLAVDITLPLLGAVGIDLGGELGGDMEPRARLTGPPDRAEAGLLKGLFVPVPSCVPGSDGSGVTARMVAWGVVELVGLVTPGRWVVVRRLPADVLRGRPNPKAAARAAPVGEADFISAPPGPGA